RLYGVLPGAERCSAGRWAELAWEEIRAAQATGKLPIVVGGTGMYLRTLMEGIAEIPTVPEAVRQLATKLYEEMGGEAVRATLARRDSETAERLKSGDRQRLIRAFEVVEATGIPLSAWHKRQGDAPAGNFICVKTTLPRPELYARCEARLDAMLEAGALE